MRVTTCVFARAKPPFHLDKVAQRRLQPLRAGTLHKSNPLVDHLAVRPVHGNLSRPSGHSSSSRSVIRTHATSISGLVANENLSETHPLGCADLICSSGRGRRPWRRRPCRARGDGQGCKECRRFSLLAYTGVYHDRCRPEVAVA